MQNQNNNELDALAEELTLRREIDHNNIIRYYNGDNKLHRHHGPAVIEPTGTKYWYTNGYMIKVEFDYKFQLQI